MPPLKLKPKGKKMQKKTQVSSSDRPPVNTSAVKHKDQRIAVLVDAQNMYHSARNLFDGRRVNFKAVLDKAIEGRNLIRAITYVISTESGEERGFFDAMENLGFEIMEKDLQIFAGGMKKADWDVGLAIDAIKIADKVDVIVLVSGDGDFEPLVQYLKHNKGCRVEVIAFEKNTSSKLIAAADDFTDLGQNRRKYLIK